MVIAVFFRKNLLSLLHKNDKIQNSMCNCRYSTDTDIEMQTGWDLQIIGV
jgi:hypothetical protein